MTRLSVSVATAAAALSLGAPALAAPQASPGAKLFETHCQICHQAGGVGVAGQFPRLAGRVGAIADSDDGRKLLPTVVLYGMSGSVAVDGQNVLGIMPGFETLKDDELAAVLTYVSSLGPPAKAKPKPFTPAQIAMARTAPRLGPSQVAAERNRLAALKVVP